MQRARSERAALVLVRKAATAGRSLSLAELNKLMVFADKESLGAAGRSLTGARYGMERNGPVVLELDDLVRGSTALRLESGRVRPGAPLAGRLSRGDEAILDAVWAKHGARSLAEMRAFSLDSREWRNRSEGIRLEDMLVDVGYPEEAAAAMAEELRYNQGIHDERALERQPETSSSTSLR